MAMNKITQIPTEKNATHLFNILSNALSQCDVGLPISAREIQIKKEEYSNLLIQVVNLKRYRLKNENK